MSTAFVRKRRNERKNIGEEEQFTRGKELWEGRKHEDG
jgi:hypothetical protein